MKNLDCTTNHVKRLIILLTIVFFIFFGLCMIWLKVGNWGTATLWATGLLIFGFFVGFLFSIPKVQQSDKKDQDVGQDYKVQINTNLEQISDWLTKIIVGLGLVELKDISSHVSTLANFMEKGVHTGSESFAGAVIIYFTTLGFLAGYLCTRLFIAALFKTADKNLIADVEREIVLKEEIPDPETASGTISTVSPAIRQAAINITSVPLSALKNPKDYIAWAKAQLLQNNFVEAVKAFKLATEQMPDDIRLYMEYAKAMLYAKQPRAEARDALLRAYRRICYSTSSEVRKELYRLITYTSLYLDPPNGFEEAIQYGEEYTRNPNAPSGAIWVNLAAAYGQKYKYLSDATKSGNIYEGMMDPQVVRKQALEAIINAIACSEKWKATLQSLLVKDYSGKSSEENDLEVFENDDEFRVAVGLERTQKTSDANPAEPSSSAPAPIDEAVAADDDIRDLPAR